MAVRQQTTLVGRDAELGQLLGWLGIGDAPAPPQVRAVLVSGDAGVGKTRLLTELRDRAVAAGWRVAAGHCVDLADAAVPYLPFSEIIGRLEHARPDAVAQVVSAHPELARLLPGRRMSTAAERGERDRSDRSDGAGSLARGDLLPAVHALLETLAEGGPHLLVIEDAHWADQATRDLLTYLFTRPPAGPVAVVASYRSDDLHRRHPLRRHLAEWGRLAEVGRLQVPPLGSRAVRRLVRQLPGVRLSEAEVSAVVRRSEGNPFFAEELVGAAGEGGAGVTGVPDDLADLLLVRLDRLGDEAAQVVRYASASGRRVGHALLAEVVGLGEQALDRALREAVERNVLEPRGENDYVFRHALLGEAIHHDLLPGESVRVHAAYAAAIAEGRAPGTAAELARHARLGNDPSTAVRAGIEAGRDAMRVGAPEEAAQHFEAALRLVGGSGVDPDDVDLPGLVTRTADALSAAGHPGRAARLIKEQLDQLPADASDVVRGQMLTGFAIASAQSTTTENLLELSEEAVRLTRTGPEAHHLRALGFHARVLNHYGRVDEARQVALDALGRAEKHDLPRLAADVLTTLVGLDLDAPSDEVSRSMEEVVARARATRAVHAELRALYFLGSLHHDRGEFVRAGEAFARGVRRAAAAGMPWAPFAFDCRFMRAVVAFDRGEWDQVEELTDVAGQAPPPVSESMLRALRLRVDAERGRPGALAAARELRRWWPADVVGAIAAGSAELAAHQWSGDADAAVETYDALVGAVTLSWREWFWARLRLATTALGVLGTAALAGASTAERERLDPIARRLAADARRVLDEAREARRARGPEARVWEARLAAEELRWRWACGLADDDAPAALAAAWERAARAADEHGPPALRAVAGLRRVEALRACGDRRGARDVAEQTREIARRLGLEPVHDELRRLGQQPTARASAAAVPRSAALTPRERDVLALVAQGRSNGEVGRRLSITPKTVSVHVSNIMAKLGAASRTEAAAVARERGLLG